MCDIVNKFIDLMKPYVLNIEEDYQKLKNKEFRLNNLDDILNLTNGDCFELLNIEYDNLNAYFEKFNTNEQEFEASKYILKTKLDEVKALPQYINANEYIDEFYKKLKIEFSNLKNEYNDLNKNFEEEKLINKYYEMFIADNVFVSNVDELKQVFEILNIDFELKNGLLIYILKENNKFYSNNDNQMFTEIEKENALNIINDYKELDNKVYDELLDAVDEYVDLTKHINEIVNYDLIKKINVCNIVLAKKIWLYQKIKFAYYNMNCKKCNCIIKEFNCVCDLYEKIKYIKNKAEVVKIIKGES